MLVELSPLLPAVQHPYSFTMLQIYVDMFKDRVRRMTSEDPGDYAIRCGNPMAVRFETISEVKKKMKGY